MCGIIAYAGHRPAAPVLMEGLRRLEYRGYDSAGIALAQMKNINCFKAPGKLAALEDKLSAAPMPPLAGSGIGHTRWATHGVPNETNAHPHLSNNRRFALVHNGIIENYRELKERLTGLGYAFYSDTDTEVLVNLIEEERKNAPDNLTAFCNALLQAEGAFALALLCLDEPEAIYAARQNAPLVVGLGQGENFIASDLTAFLAYTRTVIFLEEGEIARISPRDCALADLRTLAPKDYAAQHIEWDVQSAQKGGYKHFMLKEIFEQPAVLRGALAGRINPDAGTLRLPELEGLSRPVRLRIVACGTSYNAGLWAAPLLEQWGGIPCAVEIASEFRYRKPILGRDELVILISQSGETADTLAALKVAAGNPCPTLGLCNVMGSSLARGAELVIYTQAGPEISVASTKALCSQMALLTLLALHWGSEGGLVPPERLKGLLADFAGLADILEKSLPSIAMEVKPLAERAANARNIFFLGRGQNFALAQEGALKLKELSYVHAEAYAAGEMKHGPIALIAPDFLTIALAPPDGHEAKIFSNIQEVAARGGPIIMLGRPDKNARFGREVALWSIPSCPEGFTGFVLLPMLQLLSYEAASYLGKDVDQPRNLAKSVTVE
ncbi:MAG: glutamine--fructose-6-phosphate transaminase (isomerizing) [Deltaproteobacteria bacterium]|jgi:glucosamine--fructose-6-phosphate aminotransferase (isomerizing)|nr:glutamine--fructose-6-phosphate transaminase (isomerizing) [Deltaproteobacteria bacterium]